jgi:hypothetical protein
MDERHRRAAEGGMSELGGAELYAASHLKRRKPVQRRASRAEMEERARFLIGYSDDHGPVTVRGLYYQAEVAVVPGIGKDDAGYDKVQRQVLKLRRAGRLSYRNIADLTRWMRKPTTHDGPESALAATARLYRKALWTDASTYVEVWCEKDALAGVIYPVTAEYDVPLMVARGFSSETFCFEAVESREDDPRDFYVYALFDFDRAGRDSARALNEKLQRFAAGKPFRVIFEQIAVTEQQIRRWRLPTREPKRKSAADRKWPFPFACELDAIPPDRLRDLVRTCIEGHLPRHQLETLKIAEESERALLEAWCDQLRGAP